MTIKRVRGLEEWKTFPIAFMVLKELETRRCGAKNDGREKMPA